MFSVGSFPPMAWHTVDAIFFASIGAYILVSRTSIHSVVFGIFFLFLSAMCKQPFYLIPFVGVVFISINYNNRIKLITSILTLSLCIGIYILILFSQDAFTNFISLTSGSTKLKDLLSAGISSYLKISSLYLLPPFGMWLIIKKQLVFKHVLIRKNLVPYFFISILLCYVILY